jgi:hypothetical protein
MTESARSARCCFLWLAATMILTSGHASWAGSCSGDLGACKRPLAFELLAVCQGDTAVPPVANGSSRSYVRLDVREIKYRPIEPTARLVEVEGTFRTLLSGTGTLGTSAFDSDPVLVDTRAVPRTQIRSLPTHCSSGCRVRVRGSLGRVMCETGVIAEAIRAE